VAFCLQKIGRGYNSAGVDAVVRGFWSCIGRGLRSRFAVSERSDGRAGYGVKSQSSFHPSLHPACERHSGGCLQAGSAGDQRRFVQTLAYNRKPKVLPVIHSVLNNTPTSRNAGFSPMRAFPGHEATDPLALALNDDLVAPKSYKFVRVQQSAKAAELQTTMAKIHKDIGQASTRLRQAAIAAHNQKTRVRKANFRVGGYVLVAVPRKDRRHKLMATWRGPRRVVRLESDSILEVENLVKGTRSLVHCSHLKHYAGKDLHQTVELEINK
jgi:hypothetical protein